MKTNFKLVFIALFSALVFVGCNTDPSPGEDVMMKAYRALNRNDLQGFQETLIGEALNSFGTEKGMEILREKVLGSTVNIRPSYPKGTPLYNSKNWPTRCFHQIDIAQGEDLALSAGISCELTYAKPMPRRESQDPNQDCTKEFLDSPSHLIVREVCLIDCVTLY